MKIEQSIRSLHKSLSDQYGVLKENVLELLQETCAHNGWLFSFRMKSEESYALKLATGREVDDFFACTITVPTLKEVEAAVELVQNCFTEVNRRPSKEIRSRPTEFNFDSLRLYCTQSPGVVDSVGAKLKFEIQIKTFLEDAWSKATHDFSYKGNEISWSRERLAAQLKAILDNVELSIAEMVSLANSSNLEKVNSDYNRRNSILRYFTDEMATSGMLMPKDLRRLVDITDGILSSLKKSLPDLKRWIDIETEKGRGKNTTNLSVYSILIQTIINQNGQDFVKYLKQKNSKRKIFIPSEILLPDGVKISDLCGAITIDTPEF